MKSYRKAKSKSEASYEARYIKSFYYYRYYNY